MKNVNISCDKCGRNMSTGSANYARKELNIKSPEDSTDDLYYDLCCNCTDDLVNWLEK
ncbi:hypothetical protein KAR91_21045 [Candidatus Pacearchaeota archaeon]|nr:hypothetical protein [Candidatus Pacearchaeota archaeon]